jgi:hypothetical protein
MTAPHLLAPFSLPLTAEFAQRFAREWIDAWKAHDLERILSHYAEDATMQSPLVRERGFSADGVLRGPERLRPYWRIGLDAKPPLRFELIEVFRSVDTLAILYRSASRRRRVIESLRFGSDGLIAHAAGLYGEAPAP